VTRTRHEDEGVTDAVPDTADRRNRISPPETDEDGVASWIEEGSKNESYLNPDEVDDGVLDFFIHRIGRR
jgi:hypothetical protein